MRGGSTRQDWPPRRASVDAALLFALCLASALAAIFVARRPGSIATIWLANAVATAFIVSAPRGRAPGLLAVATLATALANALAGHGAGPTLAFSLANGAETALGAYLVQRTGRATRFASDHASLLMVLAGGALLPPLAGATLAAATLHGADFGNFTAMWTDWTIGAALGGVAVLPFALSLRATTAADWWPRLCSGWALASAPVVFVLTLLFLNYLSYSFVAIAIALALLALALPRVCTFCNTLVMVCAFALAPTLGWFQPSAPDTPLGHLLVYLAVMMVAIPTQIVAVVVARQRVLSEMLAAVGSRANEIIVLADMQGAFLWTNPARSVYWNASSERMLGNTWADNLPPPLYREVMAPMVAQASAGTAARALAEVDFPTLGRRTMDIVVQPARDEEGRQIGVLSCGTDVTELEASRRALQQLADQLQVSNQNLEQFVRIASHDLREPLNTVAQFCSLIEADPAALANDAARLYFDQVRSGAVRMKTMLDDVLRFVRLEAGTTLAKDEVDLAAMVAEALAALHSSIETAGAQVKVGTLGKALCYRGLMLLVLQNLLSNAIKFVAPGREPRVRVDVARDDQVLRLTVTDNGIGIEAERIKELGQPFRRLHSRRRFDGTGLGLAICKRIIEQHGGRLEIESVCGQGSQFHVVIPAR